MRSSIKNLKAYKAEESPELVKKKYGLKSLARLSANESVFGPSPKVGVALSKISAASLNYYPDGQAIKLRKSLAKIHQISEDNLIFGDGADELIEMLCRVFLEPGSEIIVPDPTFGEYEIQAQIEQAKTIKVPVNNNNGQIDFSQMFAAVNPKTAMVWIANPNNPTGVLESASDIKNFLAKLPKDVILVIDEAYYEFVGNLNNSCIKLVEQYPNLIVLKTLSKAYGLANLRVGYGIVPKSLFNILQAVRLPYNLSTYQIEGGAAAVNDTQYLKDIVDRVIIERNKFEKFLTNYQITFYHSSTNFIWLKVGKTKEIGHILLKNGFQVNDRLNSEWLRIALGTPEQNDGVRKVLSKIFK